MFWLFVGAELLELLSINQAIILQACKEVWSSQRVVEKLHRIMLASCKEHLRFGSLCKLWDQVEQGVTFPVLMVAMAQFLAPKDSIPAGLNSVHLWTDWNLTK